MKDNYPVDYHKKYLQQKCETEEIQIFKTL